MQPHRRIICKSLIAVALAAAFVRPALAEDASYQARLAQYTQAREAYDAQASDYWDDVVEKRRQRSAKRRAGQRITADDYVLSQPPIYSGPPRPIDPNAPGSQPPERPPVPVLADFLKAAADEFDFAPERPSELEFKRAYAKAALAAGLTRDQIVGVYAFETGGNGTYDMQAGVSATRPNAISPAIGYNQLLSTNSVSILAQHGGSLLGALRVKSRTLSGPGKLAMERKIDTVKRMITYSRSVPQNWNEFEKLAKSTAGGLGIHAAILDRDIGPLLQVQKLINSVRFARTKHYMAPLSAAELELMNLTGDGNGFDMVTMPPDLRAQVPTANFFQRSGYERNPVARRTAVVGNLIADIERQMTRGAQSPGARDLAAAF
jgi:hypothetical protein